jgi:hypothetical protein
VPPASPAHADERTITGGAPTRKCNHMGPLIHLRTIGIAWLNPMNALAVPPTADPI